MSHDDASLTPEQEELVSLWLTAQVPGVDSPAPRYTPPRHPREALLSQIWSEALEVEDVGVTDDYFALGGDSVLAIVIVSRAAQVGIDLEVRELFEARTIAGLELGDGVAPEAAARPDPVGELPLSPLQEGILFHSLSAGRHQDGYLVQAHCRVVGALEQDLLRQAWQDVMTDRPALRTAFRLQGPDGPRRWIAPSATLSWTQHDWRSLDSDAALAEYLRRDRTAGMDLQSPPLWRLAVGAEADGCHRLVWTHHHLILDGWSQQIVLRQVWDRYAALVGGAVEPMPLSAPMTVPPSPASTTQQEEHWRGVLSGALPTMVVPADPEREERPGAALAVLTDVWPAELANGLTSLAREVGVTPATVVTGCWGLVAAAVTGADHAVFGLAVSGRASGSAAAAAEVGMFVNTLLTRVSLTSQPAADWLRSLQSELTRSQLFSDTPLSRVLGWSGRRRLFDSLLVLENYPTWFAAGTEIAGLVVDKVDVVLDEGYPLVVEVSMRDGLIVRVRHDQAQVPRRLAEELAQDLRHVADLLVTCTAPDAAALAAVLGRRREDARRRADHSRRSGAQDALRAAHRRVVRPRADQ